MSGVSEFWDASSVTRGKIVAVDDGGRGQMLEVEGFSGERFSGVLRAQPHGHSSVPPTGAVGHFLRLGASDRLVAIGYETEGRPVSSPAGSSVLYDSSGNLIFAKAGEGVIVRAVAGGVEVEAQSGNVTLKRGALTVTLSETRVDLGGTGGPAVMTQAGPSTKVFAIV